MKKIILAIIFFAALRSVGQSTFFTENFETGAPGWTANIVTGTEGSDPNFFTISDNEGGVLPPGCGVASNGNKTLHITSVFNPSGGASYDAGGFCGILYCPQTNRRTESPTINCSSKSNIVLRFDFIANGEGLNDNANIQYFNGTTWSVLVASIKSPLCGSGQGQWTHDTVSLPASANNNPNVKIAFGWINNDDGAGTDPSLAINNVSVTYYTPVLTTTVQSVVNVSCFGAANGSAQINVSNARGPYTCNWAPGTPAGDGTTSVTGLAAGTWTCTVTDSSGQSHIDTITITQPAAIDTSITVSGRVLVAHAATARYQWVDCNNNFAPLPGDTNQIFTAAQNGNYAVVVTVGACSDTSKCVNINNTSIASPFDKNNELIVFPNPSDGKFTIQTSSASMQQLQIINPVGTVVFNALISGREEIDLSTLSSGIYLLSVKQGASTFNKVISIAK